MTRNLNTQATELGQHTLSTGRKVVTSHLGRVGSTVLAEMLKQHSRISWLDEYFTILYQKDPASFNHSAEEMFSMIDSEARVIWDKSGSSHVGHEIKPMNFFHNPGCDLLDYIKLHANPEHFAHIILRRRNVLKRICSSIKAAQSNTYHLFQSEKRNDGNGFTLDLSNLNDYDTNQQAETLPDLIRKSIDFEENLIREYDRLEIDYLTIYYEDDIERDPTLAYRKILDHLGLENEGAQIYFQKTSRDLKTDLKNYSEVEKQLKGSEYSWMIY